MMTTRHRAGACVIAVLAATTSICSASESEDTWRAELGGFYGHYSERYGDWGGAQGRFWLLDSTGQRRLSGYVNIIDLHWRPTEPDNQPITHSTFLLGRLMRNWTDHVYTMSTLGATIDTPVFPRLQLEQEFDFILPQHPVLVFAFGAGYRYYPTSNRPYLVLGMSYGFPHAGFTYRYWAGRGVSERRSNTHLLTWAFGTRLDYWIRVDLLWGDESHVSGLTLDTEVDSKGITLTAEKWLNPHWGVILSMELAEMSLRADDTESVMHRTQIGSRFFVTF